MTSEAQTYEVKSQKTRAELTLLDDYTGEPVVGATFAVEGRENTVTDSNGKVVLTDLEKGVTYKAKLSGLPEPYHAKETDVSFTVDKDGRIDGNAVSEINMTAYIIRLSATASDMLFGNDITSTKIRLYDANDALVEEWEGTGTSHEIEDLAPGTYTLEVGGRKSSRAVVEVKDTGGLQTVSTKYWTLWDTIAVIGALVLLSLIVTLIIKIVHRIGRKRRDE